MTQRGENIIEVRTRRLVGAALFFLGVAGLLVGLFGLVLLAHSRDLDGQYAQGDPGTREWFRNQLSPKTGGNCCSEADGALAEEDLRKGDDGKIHYWTRFVAHYFVNGEQVDFDSDWTQVPDDVVIHGPNRNGAPVVWWYFETHYDGTTVVSAELKIRCYAPGGGV